MNHISETRANELQSSDAGTPIDFCSFPKYISTFEKPFKFGDEEPFRSHLPKVSIGEESVMLSRPSADRLRFAERVVTLKKYFSEIQERKMLYNCFSWIMIQMNIGLR